MKQKRWIAIGALLVAVAAAVAVYRHRFSRDQSAATSPATPTPPARVQSAFQLAGEAKRLFEAGDTARAEELMAEASRLYPESAEIRDSLDTIRSNAAFQRKDYAAFLTIAEESAARRPESAAFAGNLASALATQYAATGEASYRTRAEQALAKAKELAARSPEAQRQYDEYAERIEHRLKTREILDRAAYDRRFRAASQEPAPRPSK